MKKISWVVFAVAVLLISLIFGGAVRAAAPVILGSPAPQAGNITGSGAQITWSTDIPSDSWVYYGTSNTPTSFPYNSNSRCDAGGDVTSHCINLTGLAASTVYYFKVVSCAAGQGCTEGSGYSFTSAASGGGGVPISPSSVSASQSGSYVNVGWTMVSDATHYNVYRSVNSGAYSFIYSPSGASSVSYSDTSASSGGSTYRYKVEACKSGYGCSSQMESNLVTLSISDTQAPSVPTGLFATSTSPSQINLSWAASTDNVGVTGYKIYRGGTLWYTTASLSFSDTGLSSNTSYNYYVQAYDAVGNLSPTSTAAFATTQSGTVSCTGLTLTFQNNKTSYVQGDMVNYTYVCSPGGSTSFVEISVLKPDSTITVYNSASGSISQNSMGFDTSNLAPGNYTLRACFTANCSGGVTASLPFTVTSSGGTTSSTIPNTPANLSYNLSNSNATVNLSWADNSTNETRFEIYRQYGGTWNYLTQTNANVATFSDNPPAGGTYYYNVAACNGTNPGGGCSMGSNTIGPITVSVNPNKPNAPSNLTASVSGSNVYLYWTDNSTNESGFKIYDGPTRGDMGNVGANVTSYTDSGLAAGTYYYKVQAFVSASGSYPVYSDVSNEVTVTVGGTSGGGGGGGSTPAAPSSLRQTGSTTNSITLAWNDNSGNEDKFNLERTLAGANNWTLAVQTGANIISYVDTAITYGTYYDYRVQACLSGYGCSSYAYVYGITNSTTGSTSTTSTSGTTSTTSTTATYPSQAYGLTASIVSGANVFLNWINSTTNATTIYVSRRPSGSNSWTSLGSVGPAATTFTDYNVPVGSYDYQLFTCNPTCPSSGSNWANVAVGTTSNTAPSVDIKVDGYDGTVYRVAPASYTLSWNTYGNPTSCVPGGTWGGGSSKSIPSGSQYFTGVTVFGPKIYTLTCSNSYGSTSDTVTVEITSAPLVGATTTQAVTTGALLQGTVTDSLQKPVAGVYVHIFTENFSLNFSAVSDDNGAFNVSLPAGTYLTEISPPSSRADLVRPAPQKFEVSNGETRRISLQFSAVAKLIIGTASFESGQAITDAEVGAYSSETNQWISTFLDGSGKFMLRVSGGKWQVGIRPRDPLVAKWAWQGEFPTVTFANDTTAETRTVNFLIPSSDAKLTVRTIDQSGNAIGNAGVVVDVISASQTPPEGTTLPPPIFRKSDSGGTASFTLKGGNYYLRAFLPPELGYINPNEQFFSLTSQQTKDISLVFRKRETVATTPLKGLTRLENGVPTEAFIWAWSEKGGTTQLRSNASGEFSFPATAGRWHVGAGKEINGIPYKSSELTVDVQNETLMLEIVLVKIGTSPLASPVSASQPSTQQIIVQAQDGAKVTVPENAGAVASGNVNVEVKPTIEAPSQAGAKVVSTAYDVNIKNDAGGAVTTLSKNIEITIPFNDDDLKAQGTSADKLVPSFYDDSAGTWVRVDNYTIDKEKKVVIVRVNHLTRFALVAAADITPPNAPSSITAKIGAPGEIILSWTNPTSDFDHAKIYRSTVVGELGKLVKNDITKTTASDTDVISGTKYYYTVRSVDPAGNESANTVQVSATASGIFKGTALPPGPATKAAILRTLQVGASGDDVKALQEILLKEGVYPAGLVTGYFGDLTRQAVIRFQEKYADEILTPNGLTSGTGTVGPSTRAKLNKLTQ